MKWGKKHVGTHRPPYKLADFSGWELFNPEPCSIETAQAIACSLPASRIVKSGETPEDAENEPETGTDRQKERTMPEESTKPSVFTDFVESAANIGRNAKCQAAFLCRKQANLQTTI